MKIVASNLNEKEINTQLNELKRLVNEANTRIESKLEKRVRKAT